MTNHNQIKNTDTVCRFNVFGYNNNNDKLLLSTIDKIITNDTAKISDNTKQQHGH